MKEEAPSPARRLQDAAWDAAMVLLAVLSLLLLAALEWGWVSAEQESTILWIDLGIVALFWLEYLWRLRQSAKKGSFVRSNWYELPGMIPILPGMEGWGGIRLFRLLRVLRVLRLVGALRRFERFERVFDRFTRQSKLGYVSLLAIAIVLAASILAWLVEPQTFPNFGDALWWAIVTSTTVGYGDFYPQTSLGRSVGVVLMLLGVGLIGTFAALLSSFLVERRFEETTPRPGSLSQTLPAPALPVAFRLPAELERLARLHERGELTDREYQEAKRNLLEGPPRARAETAKEQS